MFRCTTIILLLTLFSCGQPVGKGLEENISTEDDYTLATTDSLLSIADDRMRYIRKHSDDINHRIEDLVEENNKYKYHIERLGIKLFQTVDSLNEVIKEKEYTISSLNETIKNKDLIIQLNGKSIKHKESIIDEITQSHNIEIENLTNTIILLNDSIQDIMEIINENMKPNKVEKVFGE